MTHGVYVLQGASLHCQVWSAWQQLHTIVLMVVLQVLSVSTGKQQALGLSGAPAKQSIAQYVEPEVEWGHRVRPGRSESVPSEQA